jgi:hypothetical protein
MAHFYQKLVWLSCYLRAERTTGQPIAVTYVAPLNMSALLTSTSEIIDGELYLVANNHSTSKWMIISLLLESSWKGLNTEAAEITCKAA